MPDLDARCEHCEEGVPLGPDRVTHVHEGVDGWHARGRVSACWRAVPEDYVPPAPGQRRTPGVA